MQLFQCPFCGRRDETEFRYVGESGKLRPAGGGGTEAGEWARYLYFQANQKGLVREVWCHQTCGELFTMERNNVTHEVAASPSMDGKSVAPDATAAAAFHDLGAT